MSNQIFYVDKQKYEIPQDKVESFLQYFGDKAIPLDKMPKTSYQISTGEIFEIPYGLDKDFLSYPGYENAIKITDNSNPPINGFTTPNPAQFPNAALDGTSDDNVNAPMYDQLKLQQEELLNTSPIKVPYSVFDPEGKDYDETTARRVERAVGGMYDPMTQHWASLDPQTGMLLKGMCTLHTIQGTQAVGDVLYLSETAGGTADCVALSAEDEVVRIIGYNLHASSKQIWFDPDKTWVEIA